MISIIEFSTASYLVTMGNRVMRTERQGNRVAFYFEDTQNLQDDLDELELGKAIISASELFNNQRQLKRHIARALN